jgi:competence ComEA-like helix-hairpin-helix protein
MNKEHPKLAGSGGISVLIATCLAGALFTAAERNVQLVEVGAAVKMSRSWPDMRIDLNTAGVHELGMLPGLGPSLAERIVASRENQGDFVSLEDLARVKGIGVSILDRIRPHAVVDAPVTASEPHP